MKSTIISALRLIKDVESELGLIYIMHEKDDSLNVVNMMKWQGHSTSR